MSHRAQTATLAVSPPTQRLSASSYVTQGRNVSVAPRACDAATLTEIFEAITAVSLSTRRSDAVPCAWRTWRVMSATRRVPRYTRSVNVTRPATPFGTFAVSLRSRPFRRWLSVNAGNGGGAGTGTVTDAVAAFAGPPRPALSSSHNRTP